VTMMDVSEYDVDDVKYVCDNFEELKRLYNLSGLWWDENKRMLNIMSSSEHTNYATRCAIAEDLRRVKGMGGVLMREPGRYVWCDMEGGWCHA